MNVLDFAVDVSFDEKELRDAGFFVLLIAERNSSSSGLVYDLEGYESRRSGLCRLL